MFCDDASVHHTDIDHGCMTHDDAKVPTLKMSVNSENLFTGYRMYEQFTLFLWYQVPGSLAPGGRRKFATPCRSGQSNRGM